MVRLHRSAARDLIIVIVGGQVMDKPRYSNFDQGYFESLSNTRRGGLHNFVEPRSSRKERFEMGKALRHEVPRSAHAVWRPGKKRVDPMSILKKQNATRVPKLVPLRNARMLGSPFSFLRGGAAIMAADLSLTPSTGVLVAACGDMHVANFGAFGSAERKLIFAINDFDEVYPGPWEWDLKRLAASAAVAVSFMGGDRVEAEDAAQRAVSSYREHIRRYADMPFLEVWYDRIEDEPILEAAPPDVRRRIETVIGKARTKGHLRTLDKLTETVAGQSRIAEDIPLIVRETHRDDGAPMAGVIDSVIRSYFHSLPDDRRRLLSRYRIVDVARKVVGVGSVGTSCWVAYMQGLDENDPLFLQVKEALPSVLAPYSPVRLPFDNQGRRVVAGQRLTQGSPDIFLGWGESEGGRHVYVRQLADMKGGIQIVADDKEQRERFPLYCGLCGWALALAHAKSGDAAMIAGYAGKSAALDEAIGQFALAYLRQTEKDYAAMAALRRAGRIAVDTSVLT
jgi:uncharacterized protein (DUF2252 family)